MTKKIISLVLSALMLFALIPAAVFAADDGSSQGTGRER